ncbi:MAG TPA: flavodoxin [Gammaproteobacteria bacterium]|nr:flavodoxin [Gammaproteobacteria bacterium]
MSVTHSRTLVVYFSRSGHTRKVAEEIAARCGADLEGIQDVRGRSGIIGYWRSAREALKKTAVETRPVTKDATGYELVILGTPVWASHLCSPMRAYLTANRGKLRQVALFCTQGGGSGAEKVFREMAELCGQRPLASVAVKDSEIKNGNYGDKLDRFLRAVALPKAA